MVDFYDFYKQKKLFHIFSKRSVKLRDNITETNQSIYYKLKQGYQNIRQGYICPTESRNKHKKVYSDLEVDREKKR